ncbi:DUF2325 domain-containing protein [Xanthobacter sp. KR7-225]|uniref:DUF2325 domain-containing protein n=1 Tax=Xanthobacter sp. KR7-225 TaxID=3156613 RepID=UPI0032B56E00
MVTSPVLSPVLLGHFAERAGILPSSRRALDLSAGADRAGGARRERLWELSSNLHCSVIGTCLSTADLRQFFGKLKDPLAKTASEHEIHSLAVAGAGRRDLPGKLLHKLLDKKHEAQVRRFSKAQALDEVRALWRESVAKGEVPGAYWATLTHPLSDQALAREAFCEVHMLSHLMGMSNRADIKRLRALEAELGARDEKIARQEARLSQMATAQAALGRETAQLKADLRHALEQAAASAPAPDGEAIEALRRRLGDEQARSAALAERLAARDAALDAGARRIAALERAAQDLRREVEALESALPSTASSALAEEGPRGLDGRRLLYVGGRPRQLDQLRAFAARAGSVLLTHDGGMEETVTLLPGLVSQADIAFFPVDCVSHLASSQVKRLCREAGKPFIPLRTSGLAPFAAALEALAAQGAVAAQ